MEISKVNKVRRLSKDGTLYYWTIEWGRLPGQYRATGICTIAEPKNEEEKNFNEIQEKKLTVECSNYLKYGSEYKEEQKVKLNFLDFYETHVIKNRQPGDRHPQSSLDQFKLYLQGNKLSPETLAIEKITEDFCIRFRSYLLGKFNGRTPGDYFSSFKQVMKAATKKGHFKINPVVDVEVKNNPPSLIKEILQREDIIKLVQSPCKNHEVKKAFIMSLYTGLRWCDVKPLTWGNIKDHDGYSTYHIVQKKTKVRVDKPLPMTARTIMGERKADHEFVFQLPSSTWADMKLSEWVNDCGIPQHITWHSARHTYSVLLKKNLVDDSTIAGMLGHTSTHHVQATYRRYETDSAFAAIKNLPFESSPMEVVSKGSKIGNRAAFIEKLEAMGCSPEEIRAELKFTREQEMAVAS